MGGRPYNPGVTGRIGLLRCMRASFPLSLVVLAACGVGVAPNGPAPLGGMGCEQAQAFTFSGETSLAAIGLGDEFGGPDSQRVGMVWVTADAVSMTGPGPPPPGVVPETQRLVCVEFPDGSAMGGSVPAGWEPPAAFSLEAQPEGTGPPLVLIGLLVAGALIVGVSFVAFRGERR